MPPSPCLRLALAVTPGQLEALEDLEGARLFHDALVVARAVEVALAGGEHAVAGGEALGDVWRQRLADGVGRQHADEAFLRVAQHLVDGRGVVGASQRPERLDAGRAVDAYGLNTDQPAREVAEQIHGGAGVLAGRPTGLPAGGAVRVERGHEELDQVEAARRYGV